MILYKHSMTTTSLRSSASTLEDKTLFYYHASLQHIPESYYNEANQNYKSSFFIRPLSIHWQS